MSFSDPFSNIEQLRLVKGMRVADFGSGSGFYTFAAAKAVGDTGKVYSVDVQKDLLQKVKNDAHHRGLHNVEVIWGDIEKKGGSTLRDMNVDAVVISNVLFQAEQKENIALEAKRILKPRGEVLVIDWSDSYGGLGPAPEGVFPEPKARELFEKTGFVFVTDIDAGDHHYGLILRKP